MKKRNLKTLINDIEIALAELKSEVYSDTNAYRISSDSDKLHPIVTSTTKKHSAIDYENPCLYQGTTFTTDDINDFFGFVYCITNKINGENTSEEILLCFRTPKGKKRKQKQESDWKKYYGSSPELKEDIKLYERNSSNVRS